MLPSFQDILRPLLEELNKEYNLSVAKCTELMSDKFSLTPEERTIKLKKGNQTYIKNRTGWAEFYLEKAGLVATVSRGVYTIPEAGQKLLENYKRIIDLQFLLSVPRFKDFCKSKQIKNNLDHTEVDQNNEIDVDIVACHTADEILEEQYAIINQNLADEILQKKMEKVHRKHQVKEKVKKKVHQKTKKFIRKQSLLHQKVHENGLSVPLNF